MTCSRESSSPLLGLCEGESRGTLFGADPDFLAQVDKNLKDLLAIAV